MITESPISRTDIQNYRPSLITLNMFWGTLY